MRKRLNVKKLENTQLRFYANKEKGLDVRRNMDRNKKMKKYKKDVKQAQNKKQKT
jgi:hypothetical protein